MLSYSNLGIGGRLPITEAGGRSCEVALRPVRCRNEVPPPCAPGGAARWPGLPTALQQALRPRPLRRDLVPFQVPCLPLVGPCVSQATPCGMRVNRRVPVLRRGSALEQ